MSKKPSDSENSSDHVLPLQVAKMSSIVFEGNVIPHNWFKHLKHKNGNAYLAAIIVLSEICYWYRPAIVKDEESGKVTGYKKKFKADKLQKSYSSFSNFGLTKKQAYDACHYLAKVGLITLETRTVTVSGGNRIPNQLFIEVNADNIDRLNRGILETASIYAESSSSKTTTGKKSSPPEINKAEAPKNIVLPISNTVLPTSNEVSPASNDLLPTSNEVSPVSNDPLPESNTNTEITYKTTSDTTDGNLSHSQPPAHPNKSSGNGSGERERLNKSQFSYQEWFEYLTYEKEVNGNTQIRSVAAIADANSKTTEKDFQLLAWKNSRAKSAKEPILNHEELKFIRQFCPGCHGSGMEVVPGKGARKCLHENLLNKLEEVLKEDEIEPLLVEKYKLYLDELNAET